MTINDDLHALSEQETALTFSHFNHATAWELDAAGEPCSQKLLPSVCGYKSGKPRWKSERDPARAITQCMASIARST